MHVGMVVWVCAYVGALEAWLMWQGVGMGMWGFSGLIPRKKRWYL